MVLPNTQSALRCTPVFSLAFVTLFRHRASTGASRFTPFRRPALSTSSESSDSDATAKSRFRAC